MFDVDIDILTTSLKYSSLWVDMFT